MADTPKTKKATVLRDFRDAGTEREFKKDDTIDVTEGEFANYENAGLVAETGGKAAAQAAPAA
jgi:hypothetical protein